MNSEYGRYRIVKELGKGTMGVVYQAHDPQIDRMVALKILRPDRVTSESFVTRFLKEARAIGRLSHPNIVTIYDVGEDHGTVYIAMEYLKGEPFDEVIRSGRLTVQQCIEIARQVAQTLDYAHRQGIVHRDIKPSNIIFCDEHQVKLTDFGIARIEDSAAGQQTQAGEILGTPIYMSPEQVKGETVDGRSDLFSLGVILYEMIVGRRPFSGNNIAAIFRAITNDTPEDPAAVDPFIPKALSDIVMRSLDKHPGSRFQHGRQMADALATLSSGSERLAASHTKRPSGAKKMRATAALLVLFSMAIGFYFFHTENPMDAQISVGVPGERTANERGATIPSGLSDRHGSSEVLPSAGPAILKISSDPQGAQVFIDKGLQGITPMDISLPLGKYELRLSLTGYLEWAAQIDLDASGETPLHIALSNP